MRAPKVALPDLAIAVIHRADGSGTTFNFTDYLSKVSPDWESKVGEATSVEWPTGIGAKGNDGVANNVADTKGAIGYVEYAYAKQNKLTFADMINKDGKTVAPDVDTSQAAAANADWAHAPGFYVILANQPGEKSWPMTAATFILMYKKPADVTASNEALKFFTYAYDKGAQMAKESALRRSALWTEVKDKLNVSGLSLSGGRQQRLCIARSVAIKPEVILFDEPCSALDPISTAKIEELIDELSGDYTIAIVTHSMQQAARVSQYTAFMYLGEMVEFDETSRVFTSPRDKRTQDYITGRFG